MTREHSARPVTETTLFQAASIAKLVTATGALRLVQEGVLDLDRDVNVQLHSWRIPPNEYTTVRPVTLRQLLSHRAGVTSHGFSGYGRDEPLPSLRQILDGESPANSAPIGVDMLPGSEFRYSGGGYAIVQQLVVDATGLPFVRVMQRDVLGPALMTQSTFMLPLSDERKTLSACGHTYGGAPVMDCGKSYPETAAAWLWTTPSDLARLGVALSTAAKGGPRPILDQALVTQMLTKDADEMGLGPGVHGVGDALYFDHAGWNHGLRRERDHLIVSTPRGSSYTFYPAGDNEYFAIEDGSGLTFTTTVDSRQSALRVWGKSAVRRREP